MKRDQVLKWLYQKTKPLIPSILLIVIIGILLAITSVSMAVASKNLVDFAIGKDKDQAIFYGSIFFSVVIGQIGLRALLSACSVRIMERFSNRLRLSLYNHMAKSNWGELINYHSDDILTRMTSDVNVITNGIVGVLPSIITLGVQLLFAFFTLYQYDRLLAILAVLIGPLTALFYRLFSRKLKKLHLKIQEAEGTYRAYIHECMQNISIIKVFTLEDNSSSRLDRLQEDRMKWVIDRNRVNIAASSILSLGYYLGYMLSFAWGAFRLATGAITYGMLTAFFQLVSQVQSPFIAIARSIPQLIQAEASTTRLMELEGLTLEKRTPGEIDMDKAGLQLEEVAFEYNEDKPVIQNATAEIRAGEIVAIVGSSGEGKTTIIRLVLSLLEQKNGKICLVNGNEKYKMDASMRNLISYVPQGNTLFSGTIFDNLKIGNPNATEEEMIQALKDACAWCFVNELKDGIYSVVGEKGIGLSEGQAQRLTIARAILRKAPILILDEATSALDEVTELNVLHAIKVRNPRPTCLFITHRPTVYKLSDRILSLDNGVLTEKVS